MELDEQDIRRIIEDTVYLGQIEYDLSEIKSTMEDIESAVGWLVKRERERKVKKDAEPAAKTGA